MKEVVNPVDSILIGFSGVVRGTHIGCRNHGTRLRSILGAPIRADAGALPSTTTGLGGSIFAFRFLTYDTLSALGWLLHLDYRGPVEAGDAPPQSSSAL